ncbi:conserved hypothetical protein [Vibrio phage 501E54-1]|nr:conserved hypothetical protein [Vibrio phage 501E54-1]
MLKFKKGLLYKYNNWCDGNLFTRDYVNNSKSICPYFWGSVWNVLFVNALYLIVFTVLGIVVSLLSVEGVGLFENWLGEKGSWLYFGKRIFIGTATWVSIIGTIAGIVYSYIVFLLPRIINLLQKYSRADKTTPKKPNLLVEWVKAKKNKVCPMIEWED